MTNNDIADQFALLSRLMDLHGENSFKAKSYSIAAYTLERLPAEAAEMSDAALFAVRGIGESMGKKVRELQTTGKLSALEDIIAATPPGVLQILQIKGLGPKKTAVIWKELGIESVGELEYACQENRLASFKGFGVKTQEAVLKSIEFIRANSDLFLWAEAHGFATSVHQLIMARYPGRLVEPTSELRRQCNTLDRVAFVTDLGAEEVLSVFENVTSEKKEVNGLQVTELLLPDRPKLVFFHSSAEQFGQDLFNTTGSDAFVEGFVAKYGLPAKAADEAAIFAQFGLQVLHPALRESSEITLRATGTLATPLITPKDIRGIIHSHSKWSDGSNTIEEMARGAMERGLEYLVISDHSQSAYYANGLTPERIAAQHQEISKLNEQLAPFKIFRSIESDILNDGSLDYSEQVLGTFDLVIASVHSNLKMTQEKAMERVLTAIRNPYTTILGHPTGRLLLSRPGYPLDFKLIIEACVKNKVVIEINAHPKRLDLDWTWVGYALEQGALLSINPDAHVVSGMDDVYYGVMSAQKGGLTATGNLSSFSLKEFEVYLANRRSARINSVH